MEYVVKIVYWLKTQEKIEFPSKGFSFDWCSSGGRALSPEPIGHLFCSRSGHMPGLRVEGERQQVAIFLTHGCSSPSLSPSLSLLLKNK